MAGEADFGLSNFLNNVPQINLGNVIPTSPLSAILPTAVLPSAPSHEPIIVNAPRAQQSLTNKYSGYMRDLAGQYPPELINALMDYDSRRVSSGQSPLSETETRSVLDTALKGQQATPQPKRKIGPTSILANAVKDIGTIVTALPHLPFTLAHEATQLGQLGPGSNPVTQVLNAPGVRLIPGTMTAANILGGTPGEILRHPVMSLLDVLPGAAELAKGTAAFGRVSELADIARRTAPEAEALSTREANLYDRLADRPLSTALGYKISDTSNQLVRSGAGQFIDTLRNTPLGSFFAQHFGQQARNLMFGLQQPVADMNSLLDGTRPPDNPLEAVAKTAHDVHSRVLAIDPALASPTSMAELYDRMVDGNFDGLSDNQTAAIQVYSEAMQQLTDWALKNDKNVQYMGEIYDVPTGLKLLQAHRNLTEYTTLNRVRGAVLAGAPDEALDVLLDRLAAPRKAPGEFGGKIAPVERAKEIQAGAVGVKEMLLPWRAAKQALKNAGYDTETLELMARKSGVTSDTFRQAIQDIRDGKAVLPTLPTMTPDQVLQYATDHMGQSVGFRDIIYGIQRREWKGVTDALDNLRKEDPAFIRGVRNLRDTDRLMGHSKMVASTDLGVDRAAKNLARLKQENLAARFLPKQQKITRDIVAQELIQHHSILPIDEQTPVEAILRARDAGELSGIPGFTPEMYDSARREAATQIQEMVANGFNPMFVHTVPVNRVSQSLRFTERIEPHTPASMRARVNDLTPGIKNFAIAINDMGMQFLNEPLQDARIHWVQDNFGYNIHEVNAIVHEEARHAAGSSAAFSYEGQKAKLIAKRFRALDPDELQMFWGSPYINQLKTNKVYVPIEVYNNLKSLSEHKPFFGGIMDPATKTFRISTTALSLRTQIYNIVGGAVATELMHPGSLVKYGAEAREMLADPTRIPREFASVIGSSERTMMDLDRESRGIVTEGVRKYLVGEKLRKAWDEHQAMRAENPGAYASLKDKVNGLIKKSYHFNAVFDNFYRAVTYLAEHDEMLGKGYPEDFARFKAVGAARRVLQDYLGMTPFERNVVKSLIPFYGFVSHAIRFVLRYPFDHPLRTEFMAKLAMAEMENDTTLPNRFMTMLFFGHPDSRGNRHALNLGPFNPFGDVANSMTLAGFLGNTNPFLQTAFDMVGLNRGQAELYPSLRYNPDTGRMEASRPGFIESVMGNVVPQSGLLLSMLGMNNQYNEMLAKDPDAANRYLLSTLTVPMLERQINVPSEMFAAELAREKSAQSALSSGLKSGNWSEAMLYPSLKAYLDAVDKLTPEQKAPFAEQSPQQISDLAAQAFSGQVSPPTQTPTLDELVAAQQQVAPLSSVPNPESGLVGTGPLGLNGI